LAVVIAGVAIIAAAPVTGLDPAGTSLLIVPALGAALLGRFEAVWITLFAGLGIGMLQSELFNVQSQGDWLPNIGIQQGVPFVVVLVALVWRGSTLPGRDALSVGRLPPAVAPTHTIAVTAVVALAGVVALVVLDSEWRLAIIISGIAAIIALSIIVLTGLVGQMSLATFALAGTAAFAMIRSAESLGLPFPFAPIAGILAAVVIGTLAGLPAFRVRGLTLAVATLAASIAIEELLFKWSWFTGGATGAEVPDPSLFGIDLGISAVGDEYPQRSFGVLVLVCMFVSMVIVVNLRRRSTGRRWLAVRANERAAEAAGVSAVRAKLTANALASALAGLAGVLIAYERQVISGSSFAALQSLFAMAIAYLAGIATPVAALLAGVLAAGGLLTIALDTISEGSSKYQFTVNGLLLIVVAVRFPAGIFGAVSSIARRGRPASGVDPPGEPEPITEPAEATA
jgi:ABC-type branched-subunit amino acid transport system permease subunit